MYDKQRLKDIINGAEAIVIGAGAGLSSAAGFEYGGKTFTENFAYMHELYGYDDMYTAGFHNFEAPEEKWAFWSRFIYLNRYKDGAKPLYKKLYQLVKDKNYFVLTTNVDHQFQLAGFDKNRLFYTQGDYGLFQCAKACHNKTYDNEQIIKSMVEKQKGHKIPKELVPICPVCGEQMDTNLRKDNYFVEDDGWHNASARYAEFIEKNKKKNIVLLELGVGFNTPGIIKYPFLRMTYQLKNARYICVNMGSSYVPDEIADRAMAISDDINKVVEDLL